MKRRLWMAFDLTRYATLVVIGATLIVAGLWPALSQ